MDTNTDICRRFESQLAVIFAMDHAYYINPAPTAKDRIDYFAREQRLEQVRLRFYAELDALHSRHETISGDRRNHGAISKLAAAGEQAGLTLEQMIDLLDTGVEVETLLELICLRLNPAATATNHEVSRCRWVV